MAKTRTETDSFGPIEVPADRYWGAQTERSRRNFRIGSERMPRPLIRAFGIVKRAAAETNHALGSLDARRTRAIVKAANEVIEAELRRPFSPRGVADRFRHPDQHESQRGDREPGERTARRQARHEVAGASERSRQHEPVVQRRFPDRDAYRRRAGDRPSPAAGARAPAQGAGEEVQGVRPHRQDRPHPPAGCDAADARPGVLGLRGAGEVRDRPRAGSRSTQLYPLAQGGTAVGTGLNAKRQFGKLFARRVAAITGLPFVTAPNKFEALAAHDADVFVHGALNAVATGLFKIANDIRLLASGPRSGLGELILPENEPGSSIMPGQGQSDPGRGADDGVLPGVRQSDHDHHCGEPGSPRAQRLQAGHRRMPCCSRLPCLADAAVSFTDNCVAGIERRRGAHPRPHGTVADAGDRARPAHRLRQGGKNRARRPCQWHDVAGRSHAPRLRVAPTSSIVSYGPEQ